MKRYLIPTIIILVLASGLFIGCNNDYEQRLAMLEQQVRELSTENRLQPRVLEKKDVEAPNLYQLPLQLKVGDRVEGEISITPTDGRLYGKVKDPHGNILLETPRYDPGIFAGRSGEGGGEAWLVVPRFVVPPWRFAFIAATDGEYKLEITCRPRGSGHPQPVAYLKIVQYTGN